MNSTSDKVSIFTLTITGGKIDEIRSTHIVETASGLYLRRRDYFLGWFLCGYIPKTFTGTANQTGDNATDTNTTDSNTY